MTVDVVCAGSPFLDLVFRGLARLPAAGEEVLAGSLVVVPGAMANVAFAARQLGLEAVIHAPIGTDPAGRLLQELMNDAEIPWFGRSAPGTPVSVGLPVDGERAFVTVHPQAEVDVEAIARLRPRAIVLNLPLPDGLPEGPRLYGVVGDPQIDILLDRPAEAWTEFRAVIFNEREASRLSGQPDARAAARELAGRGCLVIVTCGERGAVASTFDGQVFDVPGLPVVALDTVGAGDLFAAAFIWADLAERPLEDALRIATAYASHSLAAPGARQKGLDRVAFVDMLRATREPEGWMLEVRG